jgi:HK97 family phage portal protein
VTVLALLSDALASADRAIAARRGGRSGLPLVIPIPQNQPISLSGKDRLVTYADSVATYPTIFAVWSKLLRNLATTDIGIYHEGVDGKADERVYGTDLEKLLREPAPGKGLVDLLQWLYNPYLVEGNGLIGKFREAGPGTLPTNLIPLDWRYMSALARPGGPVELWINYQIGEAREIDPSEVVHLAWHSPNGSDIGTSPLQSLGTAIRLDDGASRYQTSSFDNAVRPSGALVIPAGAQISPEDKADMKAQVQQQNAGIDKAFKVIVLSGGVEWKPMSFTAVEAELVNTRRASQDDVCIAYDVRRSVIAESDSAAPTGAVAERLRDFHRSLRPHTGLLRSVIKRQLIDPEPEWAAERYCVKIDISDLLAGTYTETMNTAVHGYTNGVLALNEAREDVGETPIALADDPGADTPRTPHAQLLPGRDGRTLPPSEVPSQITARDVVIGGAGP